MGPKYPKRVLFKFENSINAWQPHLCHAYRSSGLWYWTRLILFSNLNKSLLEYFDPIHRVVYSETNTYLSDLVTFTRNRKIFVPKFFSSRRQQLTNSQPCQLFATILTFLSCIEPSMFWLGRRWTFFQKPYFARSRSWLPVLLFSKSN